jgi:predicted GNAT family acetyltransferase
MSLHLIPSDKEPSVSRGTAEPVRVERPPTLDAFLERAGAFLEAHEAEHNLIFGICTNLRANPEMSEGAPTFLVATDGARIVAAGLRTPPWEFVLSLVDDPRAIDVLADELALDPDLPGVNAPERWAMPLAEAIAARTGLGTRVTMAERIYRLTRVFPPRPTSGRLRVAHESDRGLLARWLDAFGREAMPGHEPQDADLMAGRWLGAPEVRTMYVWEDGGEPVSLTGAGGPTPNGIRIGPVYTPPALRGRGYASNLVAACTQVELERGHRFAFLFTDLANPTSNAIYQAIGYEPVCDVLVVGFEPR